MRKNSYHLVFTAFFGILISCGESNKNTTTKEIVEVSESDSYTTGINDPIPTEPVEEEINISEKDIKETVYFLASDELEGRATGTKGIAKAAQYIEKIFAENGIKPYFETYRDTFNVNGTEAFNVVGVIEGTDPQLKDEYIILGAHYDHVGKKEGAGDDEIANGANDNAAGTAAVLEVAKHFSELKNNKRSIIFALFSAEEMGLKGSAHLAEKLKKEEIDLYTMLNFEMIGIPMEDKDYMAYLTGYEKSNFANLFNLYAGAEVFGFLPKAGEYQLFKRSDNYPFYKEFGIPAQTLSTFDFTNYDYYHHVEDEAQLMDYDHMARLIEKVIPGIEKMANTPQQEIKMNE